MVGILCAGFPPAAFAGAAGSAGATGDTGEVEPDLTALYQPDPETVERIRAAAASPEVRARGEAIVADDPESRVREVYRDYLEKVRASGHDLTFDLSNFKTILAEDYAGHRWLEVEDLQGQLQEPYYFDDIVSQLVDIDDRGSRIVTPEVWEELYGSPMHPQ